MCPTARQQDVRSGPCSRRLHHVLVRVRRHGLPPGLGDQELLQQLGVQLRVQREAAPWQPVLERHGHQLPSVPVRHAHKPQRIPGVRRHAPEAGEGQVHGLQRHGCRVVLRPSPAALGQGLRPRRRARRHEHQEHDQWQGPVHLRSPRGLLRDRCGDDEPLRGTPPHHGCHDGPHKWLEHLLAQWRRYQGEKEVVHLRAEERARGLRRQDPAGGAVARPRGGGADGLRPGAAARRRDAGHEAGRLAGARRGQPGRAAHAGRRDGRQDHQEAAVPPDDWDQAENRNQLLRGLLLHHRRQPRAGRPPCGQHRRLELHGVPTRVRELRAPHAGACLGPLPRQRRLRDAGVHGLLPPRHPRGVQVARLHQAVRRASGLPVLRLQRRHAGLRR
mmetsp:Transcript_75455/g.163256  ORF Transcript_75455/g.163256 Transcript_75455/m.163256 type:complete len:388 (+) Transcript_75455:211-1374(+)